MKYGKKDYARKLEEPGRSSKSKNRSRRVVEAEQDGMEKLSMRNSSRSSLKYRDQRDNISPLRRYLRSNIGKPWNEVYSQLVKNADPRKRVHLDQHIFGEVDAYGSQLRSWFNFFIDDEGILREGKRRLKYRHNKNIDKNFVKKDSRTFFRHVTDTWFELFEVQPTSSYIGNKIYRRNRELPFEIITPDFMYREVRNLNKGYSYYDNPETRFGTWRQLSKKEVHQLGLESVNLNKSA